MRPWTVICFDGHTTKKIELSAPFDQPAAHKYVSNVLRDSEIVAMIPGNFAARAIVFNRK